MNLTYYQNELKLIRERAQSFARKHPQAAQHLHSDSRGIQDPFVGQMVESFAYLTSQIKYKIDNESHQVADQLIEVMLPQFNRSLPSFSVLQFNSEESTHIPAHTLLATPTLNNQDCTFRTAWAADIQPIQLLSIKQTESSNGTTFTLNFDQAPQAHLSLYINTDFLSACELHRYLLNEQHANSTTSLEPINAFVLPQDVRTEHSQQHLLEFSAYPEKYFFFQLTGELKQEVSLHFNTKPPLVISVDMLQFNAIPVINLFPHTAEPITLQKNQQHYPIHPSLQAEQMEVYNITQANSISLNTNARKSYAPIFYQPLPKTPDATYTLKRVPSSELISHELQGNEVILSPTSPVQGEVLSLELLCTNRALTRALTYEANAFQFKGTPIDTVTQINTLLHPTQPQWPYKHQKNDWRLLKYLRQQKQLNLAELKDLLNIYQEHLGSGLNALTVESVIRRDRYHLQHGTAKVNLITLTINRDDSNAYLLCYCLKQFFSTRCHIHQQVACEVIYAN